MEVAVWERTPLKGWKLSMIRASVKFCPSISGDACLVSWFCISVKWKASLGKLLEHPDFKMMRTLYDLWHFKMKNQKLKQTCITWFHSVLVLLSIVSCLDKLSTTNELLPCLVDIMWKLECKFGHFLWCRMVFNSSLIQKDGGQRFGTEGDYLV